MPFSHSSPRQAVFSTCGLCEPCRQVGDRGIHVIDFISNGGLFWPLWRGKELGHLSFRRNGLLSQISLENRVAKWYDWSSSCSPHFSYCTFHLAFLFLTFYNSHTPLSSLQVLHCQLMSGLGISSLCVSQGPQNQM